MGNEVSDPCQIDWNQFRTTSEEAHRLRTVNLNDLRTYWLNHREAIRANLEAAERRCGELRSSLADAAYRVEAIDEAIRAADQKVRIDLGDAPAEIDG